MFAYLRNSNEVSQVEAWHRSSLYSHGLYYIFKYYIVIFINISIYLNITYKHYHDTWRRGSGLTSWHQFLQSSLMPLWSTCERLRHTWFVMQAQRWWVDMPSSDEPYDLSCSQQCQHSIYQEPASLLRSNNKQPDELTLNPWQNGRCLSGHICCIIHFSLQHSCQ